MNAGKVLTRLAAGLEARDAHTHGHSKRVARYSERIARGMNLPQEQVDRIRAAAAVHDVGKIRTPRPILMKTGALSEREFEVMKEHPEAGAKMIAGVGDTELTAIVRHHHERLDGSGYPAGLRGEEIPLGARVIAVADTFDAMTSARPYRAPLSHKRALDTLQREAGTKLDARAVAAFRGYYSGGVTPALGALLVTAPSRFLAWLGPGAGGGVAPIAQGATALGAAALIGGSMSAGVAPVDDAAPGGRPGVSATAAPAGASSSAGPTRPTGAPDREAAAPRREGGRRRGSARGPSTPAPDRSSPGATGGGPTPAAPGGGGGGAGSGGQGGGIVPEPPVNPRPTVPGVELPDVNVPDVEVPGVELPDVNVPDVNVPDVNLPDVNLP